MLKLSFKERLEWLCSADNFLQKLPHENTISSNNNLI